MYNSYSGVVAILEIVAATSATVAVRAQHRPRDIGAICRSFCYTLALRTDGNTYNRGSRISCDHLLQAIVYKGEELDVTLVKQIKLCNLRPQTETVIIQLA
jgi:hypothetical protein